MHLHEDELPGQRPDDRGGSDCDGERDVLRGGEGAEAEEAGDQDRGGNAGGFPCSLKKGVSY
jgi:hypothetical protein